MAKRPPMRTLTAALALFLLAWLVAGCGITTAVTDYFEYHTVDSGLRKRVTVSSFMSGIKGLDAHSRAWSQKLTETLKQNGGLNVLPFADLATAMRKDKARRENIEERAITAAQPMGLNAIITGQLTDLDVRRHKTGIYGFRENNAFLTMEGEVRIIEVATGTILGHRSFLAQKELSDVDATAMTMGKKPAPADVNGLLAKIVKDSTVWVGKKLGTMPWTGYVLAVEGERVKITVGRDTGLPKGAGLVVYQRGDKIKTGAGTEIYLPGTPVADAVLSELGPRISWAKVTDRAPAGQGDDAKPLALQVGQLVRAR